MRSSFIAKVMCTRPSWLIPLYWCMCCCGQRLIIFSVIRSLKLLMRRKSHCFWKYSGEYAYEITCLICACLCFLFFKCEQHIGNTQTHALFLQFDMMWYVKLLLSKTVHKDGGKLQSSWVPVCLFTHYKLITKTCISVKQCIILELSCLWLHIPLIACRFMVLGYAVILMLQVPERRLID